MIAVDALGLPAQHPACRITVCIPARDEGALIGATLTALAAQRDAGGALPAELFEVIVCANNCADDTARIVRAIAAEIPALALHLVERTYAPEDAHIGTARKAIMDLAADRFFAAGKPHGIIASLDADTVPDPTWLAAIRTEIAGRDAVAGKVRLAAAERARLTTPVRALYARELLYHRRLAQLERIIDPVLHDPAPRHGSFVGASFAVTAACYRQAGGIPPLRRLEDVAFSRALRRIDARVRHSPAVRATTSSRLDARVAGGFGTFIAELHEHARRGESFTVEHPLRIVEDMARRAALRRARRDAAHGRQHLVADAVRAAARRAGGGRVWFAPAPIDVALAMLRELITVAAAVPHPLVGGEGAIGDASEHGVRSGLPQVHLQVANESGER